MAGKNGGTWKHGWVPTNTAAAIVKAHGDKGAAIRGASRRTAKKQKAAQTLKRAQAGTARATRKK
jgi:hypothetical protein